jgi:bifunctional non-homologous end joining protein LigD
LVRPEAARVAAAPQQLLHLAIMPRRSFPAGAKPAPLPTRVGFALAMSSAEPPEGDAWLHEIKHDGHRLAAVVDGRGGLRLLSRNGYDRRALFQTPFADLTSRGRDMVLDGEIAVPDAEGCTHLDDLTDAITRSEPHRLAYFAFDLLHLGGHDLRGCQLIEREALLEEVIAGAARRTRPAHVCLSLDTGIENTHR